ncbi:hypothetical protein M422DRAFT_62732 [Sphaerobolus stellatus SS14]|nr:hypothetical protein M422DRAFT_62732 [Sphaerobolus stellatus SS14]
MEESSSLSQIIWSRTPHEILDLIYEEAANHWSTALALCLVSKRNNKRFISRIYEPSDFSLRKRTFEAFGKICWPKIQSLYVPREHYGVLPRGVSYLTGRNCVFSNLTHLTCGTNFGEMLTDAFPAVTHLHLLFTLLWDARHCIINQRFPSLQNLVYSTSILHFNTWRNWLEELAEIMLIILKSCDKLKVLGLLAPRSENVSELEMEFLNERTRIVWPDSQLMKKVVAFHDSDSDFNWSRFGPEASNDSYMRNLMNLERRQYIWEKAESMMRLKESLEMTERLTAE